MVWDVSGVWGLGCARSARRKFELRGGCGWISLDFGARGAREKAEKKAEGERRESGERAESERREVESGENAERRVKSK